jgi:hypothetical protein
MGLNLQWKEPLIPEPLMGLNLYSNCRISIGTGLDLYNLTEPPMDHTSNGTKPLMDRPLMDRTSNGPYL